MEPPFFHRSQSSMKSDTSASDSFQAPNRIHGAMTGHLMIRQRTQPQPTSTVQPIRNGNNGVGVDNLHSISLQQIVGGRIMMNNVNMNGNVNATGGIMITDHDFMNSYRVNIPNIGFDMSVDESQVFAKRWKDIGEQLANNLIAMKEKNKKFVSIRDHVKQRMIDTETVMRRIESISQSPNHQSTSSRISQQSYSATQSRHTHIQSQLSQSFGGPVRALSRGDEKEKEKEKESSKESSKDSSKDKGKEKDKESENSPNVSSSNVVKFGSRQASSETVNSASNLTTVIVSEKEEQLKAYFSRQLKEMHNIHENTLNFIEKIGKEINEKISEILSIILPNLDKFIANDLLLSIKYLIHNHKLTYHKHIHSTQMRQSLQQFVISSPTSDDDHESQNLIRMADFPSETKKGAQLAEYLGISLATNGSGNILLNTGPSSKTSASTNLTSPNMDHLPQSLSQLQKQAQVQTTSKNERKNGAKSDNFVRNGRKKLTGNTDNNNATSTTQHIKLTSHNLRNFTARQGSSRDQLSWKQEMLVSSLNENEQESNTNNRKDSNDSDVNMNNRNRSDSNNDNNENNEQNGRKNNKNDKNDKKDGELGDSKKVNQREKMEPRIRGKSTPPGILFNNASSDYDSDETRVSRASRISHGSNKGSSKSKPKLGQSQSIIYFLPPTLDGQRNGGSTSRSRTTQSPSLDSTYESQSRNQSRIDNLQGTNASELSSPHLLAKAIPESADNSPMEKNRGL